MLQLKYLYRRKHATNNKQFLATFPWQDFLPDISLTAVKIPDISRFSRQVITLHKIQQINITKSYCEMVRDNVANENPSEKCADCK